MEVHLSTNARNVHVIHKPVYENRMVSPVLAHVRRMVAIATVKAMAVST